jgi:hypothetical protein
MRRSNLSTYPRLAAACILALATSCGAQTQGTYERFVTLEYKTLKQGSSAADDKAMRQLRDEFLREPEPSAKLLIEKIQQLKSEEISLRQIDALHDSSFDYYLYERGRSGRLKGFLALLLADLYHQLNSVTKKRVLAVLGDFFTPSERYFHSNPIDWAFARIGKDSVPVWLQLANHESDLVRCHFADALTELKVFTGLAAPRIDCRASPIVRGQQIAGYSHWWEQHSEKATWQSVPSFFDEVASRKRTSVKQGSNTP